MVPDEAVKAAPSWLEGVWPAGAYVELDCPLDRMESNGAIQTADPDLGILLTGFGRNTWARTHRGRWGTASWDDTARWLIAVDGSGPVKSSKFVEFKAASRFHGASIAGIVVGAMGCFIFGLYLRRWLRERKAAA
jgi:hypothetical protein